MPIKIRSAASTQPAKRGPGRPKGSKNKPKPTPAAKATGTKRGPGRPRKQPEPVEQKVDGRKAISRVDPDVYATYEDALRDAGDSLREAQAAHTEALQHLKDLASAAFDDGMPMTLLHQLTGISRQWLYNMHKHETGARSNGRPRKSQAQQRKASTSAQRPKPRRVAGAKASSGTKRIKIKTR